MDPTMLVWMLRIQETENLLNKRKADLEAQHAKRQKLEQELAAEEQQQEHVLSELAVVHGAVQTLTHSKIKLKQDIREARDILQEQLQTSSLTARQHVLQQQLSSLTQLTTKELTIQQQYQEAVDSHMQDKAERTRQLQERARKVQAKLDTLKQQEEKLCLAQHLSRLTDKHKQLESEVQQLTQTLTTSKQANVMARSRVAVAVSKTESELKESKDRCAELKSQAFDMNRQQAVNNARLKHLQQESSRVQRNCAELDQLIARASATIEQLASSCDL